MKKIFSTIIFCVAAVLALTLTACNDVKSETVFDFTYRNSECFEEKDMYFNEDFASIVLNAKFEIENGIARMQIRDKKTDQVIWEKTATKTENFDIELSDVAADTECVFSVETEQTNYIHLLVTSPVKLVKNKVKPEIPEVK